MLDFIFHPPANFIRERNRLKYENSGNLQKTTTIGPNLTTASTLL